MKNLCVLIISIYKRHLTKRYITKCFENLSEFVFRFCPRNILVHDYLLMQRKGCMWNECVDVSLLLIRPPFRPFKEWSW